MIWNKTKRCPLIMYVMKCYCKEEHISIFQVTEISRHFYVY